ncbi:MAG: histidine kinase [Bdellovibrio sp.]|nr:histidine kinase [Bdellovibrio sp.]
MRPEITTYLIRCLKALRSVLPALAVGLAFAVVSLVGKISSGEKIVWIKIFSGPLIYSLCCFLSIWLIFCIVHAVYEIINKRELRENFFLSFVISFIGMIVGLLLARYFQALYEGYPANFSNMGGAFLVGTFITLMFLFYFYYKSSAEENIKLQALNAENELHVLKNQMRPHFLFNTLNGLSELIESDPQRASIMTQMLADLYREILKNSKTKTVKLVDEISLVEKYIKLEQYRYGKRLDYKISLSQDPVELEKIYIPSLVVQTLVENAIKHGISPAIEGGIIDISVVSNNGGHQVTVENTGAPVTESKGGTGIGITNTISRLHLLYGERHGFSLTSKNKTIATFWMTGEKID